MKSITGVFSGLLLAGLAAQAAASLAPRGSYQSATATIDNYTVIAGVPIDVKAYWPVGAPARSDTPLVLYSPGGGSGAGGAITEPVQFDALWRLLAGAGATVLYLQNERESAPGLDFFELRTLAVRYALDERATFNTRFGTAIGDEPRAVVVGWSLGAAAMAQHAGADLGAGPALDDRILGALLYASPALGAYGGRITEKGMQSVTRPALMIFGTDDMGQPGTFKPTDPPPESPRGLAAQAAFNGDSPALFAVAYDGLNHFEYGSSAALPGTPLAATIASINDLADAFIRAVLGQPSDCGVLAGNGWQDPTRIVWFQHRCALDRIFADRFDVEPR